MEPQNPGESGPQDTIALQHPKSVHVKLGYKIESKPWPRNMHELMGTRRGLRLLELLLPFGTAFPRQAAELPVSTHQGTLGWHQDCEPVR